MTGYGRGEAHNDGVAVVVELRSKNNRFRDLHVRCPREYAELESRIAAALKGPVQRGRVDASVHREARGGSQRVRVDAVLARSYVEAIEQLATQMPMAGEPPSLAFVLQQPGVLTVQDEVVDLEAEWPVVEAALEGAMAELLAMRRTEGAALQAQLVACLERQESLINEIGQAAEGIAGRVLARLQGRLAQHGVEHDPWRVAQEVALLAEKADIREELVRLGSHVEQFREALAGTEPVGRRMEFLLQEMNREVNTIGSKSAEHPISQRVVDLKAELERMREQSANVQ